MADAQSSALSGLTWGHRRAIDPLLAASTAYAKTGRKSVDWEVRDLGRFEHEPLHETARRFDLVVFDHPFCGVIAASGCFLALPPEWLEATLGSAPERQFIGPSFDSYRFAGEVWGVPVDGASNHAVFRPDLVARFGAVPQTWDQVVALGGAARRDGLWLCIGASGHHSFLAAAALMANAGSPLPNRGRAAFALDRPALVSAIDAIRTILDLSPPEALDWNSIGVSNAMVERDDLVYCPIVYGFAAYGEAGSQRRLGFGPFPGARAPHCRGSVLGGAGIGISSRCEDVDAALAYLAFVASAEVQLNLFARHSGQPGRIEAWNDPEIDELFNGFFSAVASTLDASIIRPRFLGYQQFEKAAGTIMEAMLRRAATTDEMASAVIHEAERVRQGALEAPYATLAATEKEDG